MAVDQTYTGKVYARQDGDGFFDENVTATTSTSISNYGFHVIGTTKAVTLDPPVLGAIKVLQFNSTLTQKIKSGTTGAGPYINAAPDIMLSMQFDTTKGAAKGGAVTLRGASTALWYVAGITAPPSTVSTTGLAQGYAVILTSAT